MTVIASDYQSYSKQFDALNFEFRRKTYTLLILICYLVVFLSYLALSILQNHS